METLALCIHKIPVKFDCASCIINGWVPKNKVEDKKCSHGEYEFCLNCCDNIPPHKHATNKEENITLEDVLNLPDFQEKLEKAKKQALKSGKPVVIYSAEEIKKELNKNKETITIKKSLWDEILGYKNKINYLESEFLLKKHNNSAVLEHQNKLIEKLQNKLAELSMKINQQQSSLREFEKQKIIPTVKDIMEMLQNLDKRLNQVEKMNEHLRANLLCAPDQEKYLKLEERIKTLEQLNKKEEIKSNNCDKCGKTINNILWTNYNETYCSYECMLPSR